MKLSHETRETKQATSNKKQQEPIDEGTKNSTSLPNHSHGPLRTDADDARWLACPSNRHGERDVFRSLMPKDPKSPPKTWAISCLIWF